LTVLLPTRGRKVTNAFPYVTRGVRAQSKIRAVSRFVLHAVLLGGAAGESESERETNTRTTTAGMVPKDKAASNNQAKGQRVNSNTLAVRSDYE
jgi:hypothetical protein